MNKAVHDSTLSGCFPHLAATGTITERVGEGWDSRVLVLDHELVVRLPRRVEAEHAMRVEARVLGELLGPAELPAPRPVRVCDTHGSMVYERIPGEPLTHQALDQVGADVLAGQIGAMLEAVWALPVDSAGELGVPKRDLDPILQDFHRCVVPLVQDPRAEALIAAAAQTLSVIDDPVVIHADLGPAHLLCTWDGLAGVIDWSDVSIGDRATDLGWLLNGCERRLRAGLIRVLNIDGEIVARADLIHRLGPWWEVLHGLDTQQPEFVSSGLEGIYARLA